MVGILWRPNARFQRRRWQPPPTGTSVGTPPRHTIAPSSGAAPAASAAKQCWAFGLTRWIKNISFNGFFSILVSIFSTEVLLYPWLHPFHGGASLSLAPSVPRRGVVRLPAGCVVILGSIRSTEGRRSASCGVRRCPWLHSFHGDSSFGFLRGAPLSLAPSVPRRFFVRLPTGCFFFVLFSILST